MKTIGIVGLGNMGFPIYKTIETEKQFKVIGYDPYVERNDFIHRHSLQELVTDSDIIILCVKPDKILSIIKELKEPKIVLSIAAGVSLESMKKNLSNPEIKLVRLMPNLPLVLGEGTIGYIGDESVYPIVKQVFNNMGLVYELPNEDLIDSFTALCGSGPAFVFNFIQAMAEGGLKSGFNYTDSLKLAIQTIKGSVLLMEEEFYRSKTHPIELKNRVTSPAGTTIFGLSEWEKKAVNYSISESVFQAMQRSLELKKKSNS
jgi:pyrroline-5-carboxylate reductase